MTTSLSTTPPSDEVWQEARRAMAHFLLVLQERAIDVSHVYGAWYSVDSDMTMEYKGEHQPCDCVIYTTGTQQVRTALIVDKAIITLPGWHGPRLVWRHDDRLPA